MGRIKRKGKPPVRQGLPEMGKIKTGIMVQGNGGRSYPSSVDYFVFKTDQPYHANILKEVLGDKPQILKISFPINNVDTVCNERHECRDGAGKLVGYGDGETYNFINPETMEYDKIYIVPEHESEEQRIAREAQWERLGTWKESLTIRFLLLNVPLMGIWTFTTYGRKTSIPNIRDTFDMVYGMANGRIAGVVFDLTVKKVKSNKPGDKRFYPVVSLHCNMGTDSLEAIEQLNLADGEFQLLSEQKIKALGSGEPTEDTSIPIDAIVNGIAAASPKNLKKAIAKYKSQYGNQEWFQEAIRNRESELS